MANQITFQGMGVDAGCQEPLCVNRADVYVKVFVGRTRSNLSLCLRHGEELLDRMAREL